MSEPTQSEVFAKAWEIIHGMADETGRRIIPSWYRRQCLQRELGMDPSKEAWRKWVAEDDPRLWREKAL